MMMNYLYELDAWCTSIVARMSNGTVFMARTLDFYFPNATRKIMYVARYQRGDTLLFEAPTFAGMTAVFTGYKPKAFSLAINERTTKESNVEFFNNLALLFSGSL